MIEEYFFKISFKEYFYQKLGIRQEGSEKKNFPVKAISPFSDEAATKVLHGIKFFERGPPMQHSCEITWILVKCLKKKNCL